MIELDKALVQERAERTLAPIGEALFEQVARYIKRLESLALEAEGIDNEILVAEINDVKKKMTYLFEFRLKKITCLDDTHLIADEQKIFKHFYSLKQQYRAELLEPILKGECTFERDGFIKAKVISPLPSFLDGELRSYGPYNPGDVDHFPEEIHALLKKHGVIE